MPFCRAASFLKAARYVLLAVLFTPNCGVSYALGPAQVGNAEEKSALHNVVSPWGFRHARQLEATSGSGSKGDGGVPHPLSDEDLVFVTGTDGQRLPLAQASRSWRRGGQYAHLGAGAGAGSTSHSRRAASSGQAGDAGPITVRAFIAYDNASAIERLNAEHGAASREVYEFFPSEGAPELHGVWHGSKDGDTRMALAPWLAHR